MRHALGIDIGGTHTKVGIVDENGTISHIQKFKTDARGDSPAAFLNNLKTHIETILSESHQSIVGIGLSVHGHIDRQRRGQILCNSTPALRGLNLAQIIEEQFNFYPVINNDLTAHALSEYYFGVGQGSRRFLCLAIGTGLGAGVIVEGEPLRYIEGTPGDTGRIVLDPDGPVDAYGVRGTAEILCGVSGIERLAKERYGIHIPAHEVITAARQGNDPIMVSIMQQIGKYLGQTLATLSPIFLPDRIALTGGTTESGNAMLIACEEQFREIVGPYHKTLSILAPDYYTPVDIVYGSLRGETGVVGAVVELFID
jgi:glucokinase